MNDLIPLMVIVPIIVAILLNLFSKQNTTVKILSFLVAIVLPIIPILSNYGLHYFGGHAPLIDNGNLLNSLPSYISDGALSTFHIGITYSFESLQRILLFFLFVVGFLCILTTLGERKRIPGSYMFLMFMGLAAVTAMLLSDDIFHMYIFFEIAIVAQVGIVLASTDDLKYEVAMKYLLLGSVGGPILLIGIGFLLGLVGSVNITDIVYAVKNGLINTSSPVFLFSFGLIFFGWLYSVGLPPFHTIKSSIYSKAVPSGSALLQALSVVIFISLGITIFRIYSSLPLLEVFLIFFSLSGMILSLTMAIMENDFKRMIGFLAVGELGYIGLGFGIGTKLSLTAALFQGLNEIIITAILFIGFGVILYLTKISDITKLGGLIENNPKIAIIVLLGGFAMAGVPPLNGFQSKLMLIQSALNDNLPELAIIMILISIITFMTFMKAFHSIYLKPKPKNLIVEDVRVPRSSIFAMAVLIVICIVLGIMPTLVTNGFSGFVGGLI
ncbi:MAG: energy conserving hydrogenase EhbF [Methanobrevibacter sp.]|jgi:energy-converting hydrogenase B subunit F|nr:energy conserving hydrogenase EhbF [Candidatus Methanovirga basalitermitum]